MCKEFYEAYVDWIDSGAHEDCPFTRYNGSLVRYGHQAGWNFTQRNHAAAAMRAQFDRAGLNLQYPFNTGKDDYGNEIRVGEAHLNNARIAWVNKEWLHYV